MPKPKRTAEKIKADRKRLDKSAKALEQDPIYNKDRHTIKHFAAARQAALTGGCSIDNCGPLIIPFKDELNSVENGNKPQLDILLSKIQKAAEQFVQKHQLEQEAAAAQPTPQPQPAPTSQPAAPAPQLSDLPPGYARRTDPDTGEEVIYLDPNAASQPAAPAPQPAQPQPAPTPQPQSAAPASAAVAEQPDQEEQPAAPVIDPAAVSASLKETTEEVDLDSKGTEESERYIEARTLWFKSIGSDKRPDFTVEFDEQKPTDIKFKSERELSLEAKVQTANARISFLQNISNKQAEQLVETNGLLRTSDSEGEFFKRLAYSAFSHTDNGPLLIVERRHHHEAVTLGITGEVLGMNENLDYLVHPTVEDAKEELKRLRNLEKEAMRKLNQGKYDKDSKFGLVLEHSNAKRAADDTKGHIGTADKSVVIRSVVEAEQDPDVVASLTIQEKDKKSDDKLIGIRIENEKKLKIKPIQRSLKAAQLEMAGLDMRIVKAFLGGLAAKYASKKLGKGVMYRDKLGFGVATDEEMERWADEGLEEALDNASLRTELETTSREKRQLEKKIGEAEDEADKARAAYTGTKEGLDAANKKLEQANLTLQLKEQLIKQYEGEIKEGNTALAKKEAERAAIQAQYDELSGKLDKLKGRYKKKGHLEKLSKAQLRKKIQNLEKKIIKMEASHAGLLAEADAEIDGLILQRKTLEKRISELNKRPTPEYMTALVEEIFDTHVSVEQLENELIPLIIGYTLQDQVSKDKYRADIKALRVHYKGVIRDIKEQANIAFAKSKDSAHKYKARLNYFIQRIKEKSGAKAVKRIKEYTSTDSIIADQVRAATVGLGLIGETDQETKENHEELAEVVRKVVASECKGCRQYEVDFITKFYVDRVTDSVYLDSQLEAANATLMDTIEQGAKKVVEITESYEAKLKAERKKTSEAKAEAEAAKELAKSNNRKYNTEKRKRTAAEDEAEEARGEAKANDKKYKTELKKRRAADRKVKDTESKLEALAKSHQDALADAEAEMSEIEMKYSRELAAMSHEFQVEMSEREVGARINFEGYQGRLSEVQEAYRKLKDGLFDKIGSADIEYILEKGEWKTESLDKLKSELPQSLHPFVNLIAFYEKQANNFRRAFNESTSPEIDWAAILEYLKKGDNDKLKEVLPPNVYLVLQEAMGKDAPHGKPGAPGRDGMPYGRDTFARGGYGGPFSGYAGEGGPGAWITRALYEINDQIGGIKGTLNGLKKAVFAPAQCPVQQNTFSCPVQVQQDKPAVQQDNINPARQYEAVKRNMNLFDLAKDVCPN